MGIIVIVTMFAHIFLRLLFTAANIRLFSESATVSEIFSAKARLFFYSIAYISCSSTSLIRFSNISSVNCS